MYEAFDEAASELGLEDLSPWFSVHIHTPAWLAGRRAIRSAADYDAWLAPADEARRVIALAESFLVAVRSAVAAQD